MDGSQLRILLVEDNPLDARILKQALAEAGEARFELECADRLSAGLQRLAGRRPDAIVLDLMLPDSRGFQTFAAARAQARDIPIIVLTSVEDESVAVQAVREGAQDYLVKGDIARRGLVRSILYAVERNQKAKSRIQEPVQRAAKILSFIGAKGGVGTTTVALNTAAVLVREHDVALVELSPLRGTMAGHLRLTPAQNLGNLLRLPADQITAAEIAAQMCKLPHGLKVLFSPQSLSEFHEIDAAHAEAMIKQIAGMAEFAVLDLPPNASASNRVAVQSSDFAVIVLEPEPICIDSAKAILDLLKGWGMSTLVLGAVVVNRGLSPTPIKPAEIKTQLGCDLVGVIPPIPEAYHSVNQSGLPVVFARPESNASMALAELSQRLRTGIVAEVRR